MAQLEHKQSLELSPLFLYLILCPDRPIVKPSRLMEATMNLNPYIHGQLAAGYQRDLLDAGERGRLAAQARPHERHPFRFRARRALRPRPALDSCLRATSPRTATR